MHKHDYRRRKGDKGGAEALASADLQKTIVIFFFRPSYILKIPELFINIMNFYLAPPVQVMHKAVVNRSFSEVLSRP